VDTVKLRQRGQSDDQSPPPAPLTGYLSNYVTELTGCGNIDSPWQVRALPGQRVNLTLVDFGVTSLSAATSASSPADTSANAVPSVCQVGNRARQLYKNISMLFLFPVKDGKLSTGVNATFNASCYG